jgi:hypothetical protein
LWLHANRFKLRGLFLVHFIKGFNLLDMGLILGNMGMNNCNLMSRIKVNLARKRGVQWLTTM